MSYKFLRVPTPFDLICKTLFPFPNGLEQSP